MVFLGKKRLGSKSYEFMLLFLFIFECFLFVQLNHPFLWHAYEVKKVNLIYFLIFDMKKVLCLLPSYTKINHFKKCGEVYFRIDTKIDTLFERDLERTSKAKKNCYAHKQVHLVWNCFVVKLKNSNQVNWYLMIKNHP